MDDLFDKFLDLAAQIFVNAGFIITALGVIPTAIWLFKRTVRVLAPRWYATEPRKLVATWMNFVIGGLVGLIPDWLFGAILWHRVMIGLTAGLFSQFLYHGGGRKIVEDWIIGALKRKFGKATPAGSSSDTLPTQDDSTKPGGT